MIPCRRPANALAYLGTSLAVLGVATAAQGQASGATATAGPARVVIERWIAGGRDVVCTDASGADEACDLGRVLNLRTFYGEGGDALAFVAYTPAVGNAVALAVGQFRRDQRGWSLVRTLKDVFGEGPDTLSFEGGRAVFTMRALMPGDARCCLTGKKRYELDLATGSVRTGPKIAGKPIPASTERTFAPRPDGYQGASYLHNGSQVLVDERAGIIRYEVPKVSLRGVASKGTVLFRGRFAASGAVSGTAYVFKVGCEPASYAVSGRSTGSTIVLKGQAPRRDPHSCAVTGPTASDAHTVLRFDEHSGDF